VCNDLVGVADMNQDQAKAYLDSLSNKQLVELLLDVLNKRRGDEGAEAAFVQAHWCVAEASRMQAANGIDWEAWDVELLAAHDSSVYDSGWDDQALLCQSGQCGECGMALLSWAKAIVCPVCGSAASAT